MLSDVLKDTKLNETDKKALNEFIDMLHKFLAENLESVMLYGSEHQASTFPAKATSTSF
jgi:hypothetical protein